MFGYRALNHDLDSATGEFWVVTHPSESCTESDILFKTTVSGLALQIKGGLQECMIVKITKDERKAKYAADILIEARNRLKEIAA